MFINVSKIANEFANIFEYDEENHRKQLHSDFMEKKITSKFYADIENMKPRFIYIYFDDVKHT